MVAIGVSEICTLSFFNLLSRTPKDNTGMSQERLASLGVAFSPSAPISSRDLFRGRYQQLEQACAAVNEKGQHFIVFGERGVGKTSFANIIDSCLKNVVVIKVTCNRNEDFKQVWEKALAKVRFATSHDRAGFHPEKIVTPIQLDLFLPANKAVVDPLDIQTVLERVRSHLLFVFDEFDTISSNSFKRNFADTIKALSDNSTHVTIGLVGVSDTVEALLGSHASLERCVKQIRMPRMSKDELGEIITTGLKLVGIDIDPEAYKRIVSFSSGFPHFTHLLTKFAARHCIEADQNTITMPHYKSAINDAIRNVNESIRDAYQKATIASKAKSKFEDVLAACALADEDEFGAFATNDLVDPYYRVTGVKVRAPNLAYNLQRLCDPERGSVLTKIGASTNIRYSFTNPLMKVFVKLKLDQFGSFEQPNLFIS